MNTAGNFVEGRIVLASSLFLNLPFSYCRGGHMTSLIISTTMQIVLYVKHIVMY